MYNDDASGKGVTVYVIDTGVLTTHVEFQTSTGGSRAHWGANFIAGSPNTDENGHGTHCAGTVAGKTYGVAKDAQIVAVKVLNKQGSGTNAGVIDGVNYVHDQARLIKGGAAVASMSLGGGKSVALNDAVTAAITDPESPTIFSLAAGNDNKDAAGVSPASATGAITVAASDNTDKKASFSNWGKTVALYGPGVAITSAWIGSDTATNTISGTSMACPHVSGVIAKFLQTQPKATAGEVKGWLTSVASQGTITNGAIGGTPNLLLFADCSNLGFGSNSTLKLHKRY
jgi:subtilisin family serine protease